ncbi:uncharacterized protein [Nicotiana tomentosiformis]|uniref:uncharacterized protein n=1 Tax=Nicotiana tomentosiformis TaxID=4098 RepID=UPI00388C66B5
MKINLDDLDKLGHNICEDLVKYNKERWRKAFFQTFSKCDSVDNNMCESFNTWILGPRHKTIISMLEEIRVKVMSRVAKMREFAETWQDGVYPMAMMVFNTNVEKSMRVDFIFNGDTCFELKDGPYKFIVDLRTGYRSCRSWELKGISCPYAITAMHFKRLDPSENIVHWYIKETYMKAYSHFIQPVPNMIIWPESSNPKVLPPPVQNMPGRVRKNRRKEVGEIKRAEKLSKKGITMTCSICKASTHNMRSCPTRPTTNQETTNCSQQSTTKPSRKRGRKESDNASISKASTSTGGKSGGGEQEATTRGLGFKDMVYLLHSLVLQVLI